MSKDDGKTIEITRIFDATCAEVFTSWLDRDEWQSWIGPEGVNCDVPLFEAKVGGHYRLVMHLPNGKTMTVAGVFKSISPNENFSFTWGEENTDQSTLVTVSLRDVGGKTELTLRHDGLPNAESREGHASGWNSALNKLDAHLATK